MNYAEQRQYLRASRLWAAGIVLLLLAAAALTFTSDHPGRYLTIVFWLIIAALAGSLFYTPNYLHLTVDPEKPTRWQIKIRWRIIAAVLVLGLIPARDLKYIFVLLGSAFWLAEVSQSAASAAGTASYAE